jgi:hypothetical protein
MVSLSILQIISTLCETKISEISGEVLRSLLDKKIYAFAVFSFLKKGYDKISLWFVFIFISVGTNLQILFKFIRIIFPKEFD